MTLPREEKEKLIAEYGLKGGDTGSSEVQVALLTARISQLTRGHFGSHPKDKHSLRGLQKMVSLRKRLMKYLKSRWPARYSELVRRLGIRR